MDCNLKGRVVGYLTAHIVFCYRCFLPDLTGFTKLRCVRPNKTAKNFKRRNSAGNLQYLYPAPNRSLGLMSYSHLPPWQMVAEREGFEPSVGVNLHTLSKRAPSTARPPLLLGARPASNGSAGWNKFIFGNIPTVAQLPPPERGILTKKGREHVRLFDVGPDHYQSVLYSSFIRRKIQG